jgi:hypothetical protein
MEKKKLSTLIFVVVVGMVLGAVLHQLIGSILPAGAPKSFFTKNFIDISFGFGDDALLLDLYMIKIKLGIKFIFNAMSIVGLIISVYLFRWYR